jgi:hypothetical protein
VWALIHQQGGVAFDAGGTRRTLSVAKTYKHMGSVSRPDGRFLSEIRYRAARAYEALDRLAPRVLRSPRISGPVKRVFINANVFFFPGNHAYTHNDDGSCD